MLKTLSWLIGTGWGHAILGAGALGLVLLAGHFYIESIRTAATTACEARLAAAGMTQEIETLRRLADERDAAYKRGVEDQKRLGVVVAEIKADTTARIEKVPDVVSHDPVCRPSADLVRLRNDAIDFANRALRSGP